MEGTEDTEGKEDAEEDSEDLEGATTTDEVSEDMEFFACLRVLVVW